MTTKLFDLSGKTAIVTGALGLIGKEHCYALAESGASIVAADIDADAAGDFAGSLPTPSMGCYLNVTDKNSVLSLLEKVAERFGKIDILVNNAAINDKFENPLNQLELSAFENYPLELWQASIDVNLTGVFLCTQVIGTHMAQNRNGSIINIASTYGVVAPDQALYVDNEGRRAFYKPPAYSATKGGVIALTKFAASYWGDKGVRANVLSPGGVENNQDDFFINNYSLRTPLGRMAKPGDYKGALIFLASDASSYMTGANLIVDGGWTCR